MALDNLLRRALTMALVIPIRLYRLFLSPLVGPACRFSPSCSEYAIEALHQHGPIKGTVLGGTAAFALPPRFMARRFVGL